MRLCTRSRRAGQRLRRAAVGQTDTGNERGAVFHGVLAFQVE